MDTKIRQEQETQQVGIITCIESERFRPYRRLIAAVLVFCFVWLEVRPALAQQSVTPEVKPSTDTTYVERKDLPRSDYEPVRQTFEKIQMLQGKELEAYKKAAVTQNNFEASYYRYISNLFNTLGISQRMAASTTEGFRRLREISINTTVTNLSNVFPLHYFYKDGDYTEFVNGLPYRSTRKVPNGEGAMLHEITLYRHNTDRLLIRTTSNYYDTEGGKLLSRITREITPETGSVWYAINSGKKQTKVYNLVKSIHQVLEDFRENYTVTTDTNYINDKQARHAKTWSEISLDSRFPNTVIKVEYDRAEYNDENNLWGVRKQYSEITKDAETGELVMSKQWTEYWSGMEYVAGGQLLAAYKVKKEEIDENGQMLTTYTTRQNTWDDNNGKLLGYRETFTDPFGVVTEIERSDITYNEEGVESYNQATIRYQKDEKGRLILNERRTTKRTTSQYRDGKLVGYTEEVTDENGIPHTYKYTNLTYDRGRLAGYDLIEIINTPTADGEYRKETKQSHYTAKYDQYGRIQDEEFLTHTIAGRPQDGPILDTTQTQNIHYSQYYLTGRPKAYTVERTDTATPGKKMIETYENIKYEKGQIKAYRLTATSSDTPDKKEITDVTIEYDKYGRGDRTTEVIREIGKGIDVTTTRVTVVKKWDAKGRKVDILRTTVKSGSPDRIDTEYIKLVYDAAGDVGTQDVTTHVAGTDAKGQTVDAIERAITTYKHDSAGNVSHWVVKTIDQFGNVKIEEGDATPVDLTKLDQLGLALEEQNVARTPSGEIVEKKINGYNSLGQLTHFRKISTEYDMDGNVLSITEQVVSVKYDEFGRAVETKTGSLKEGKITWETEKVGAFNRLGQMTKMTRTSLNDDGQVKIENFSYTYDTFGRPLKVLDSWTSAQGPGYIEETYYYNPLGLVDHKDIRSSNPLQPVIQGTTYEQGRIFYKYNIYGQVITETGSGIASTPYGNNLRFTSSTQYIYDLKGRLIENHLARSDGTVRTKVDTYFTYKNGKLSDVHTIKNISTQGITDTLGHFEYNNRGELTSSIQTEKRGGYTTVDTSEITYDQNHLISGTTQAQTKTDAAGNYYAAQSVYQVLTRDAKLKIGKYSNATLVYGKLGSYILNPNKFWVRETCETQKRDALGRPTLVGVEKIDESKAEGHGRTSQGTRTFLYNELGNVISEREIENTTSGGKNITRDTQTSNITYVFVPGLGYLRNSWLTVVTTTDRNNPNQKSTEQFQRFYTTYYPAGHIWAGLVSGYKERAFDKIKKKWGDAEATTNVRYNMLNQLVFAKSGKYSVNYYYRPDGKQDYQTYSGGGAHGKTTYIYNQYGELTRTEDKGSARVHEKKTTRQLSEEGKTRRDAVNQNKDLTPQERQEKLRQIDEDYMVVAEVEYEAVSSWTTVTDYNYLNNGVKNEALSHSSSRTIWLKQDGNTYYYFYRADGQIDHIDYTLGASKQDGYRVKGGSGTITYIYEGNKLIAKIDNGRADIRGNNHVNATQTWSTYSDYKGDDKWEKNEDKSTEKTKNHERWERKTFRIAVDTILSMAACYVVTCDWWGLEWLVAGIINCLKAWFDAYMATGESSMGDKQFSDAFWKSLINSTIQTVCSYYSNGGDYSSGSEAAYNVAGNVVSNVASEYAAEAVADYGQDHGWSEGEIAFWSTLAGAAAGAAVSGNWEYAIVSGLLNAVVNYLFAEEEERLLDRKKKKLDEKYGKDEDIAGTQAAEKKRQEYNRYKSRIDFNYGIVQNAINTCINYYIAPIITQFTKWIAGDIKQTADGRYWSRQERTSLSLFGLIKWLKGDDGQTSARFLCFGSFWDMLNGKLYAGKLTEGQFREGLEACGMSNENIGELTKGMKSDSNLEGANISGIEVDSRGEFKAWVKGKGAAGKTLLSLGNADYDTISQFGSEKEREIYVEYEVTIKKDENGEFVAEYEKTGNVRFKEEETDLTQNGQTYMAEDRKLGNNYTGEIEYNYKTGKLDFVSRSNTLAGFMESNMTEDSRKNATEATNGIANDPKEFQHIEKRTDVRAVNNGQTPDVGFKGDIKLGKAPQGIAGWLMRLVGISKYGNIKDEGTGKMIREGASKLRLGADDVIRVETDEEGNIYYKSLRLGYEIRARYARGRMETFMKYDAVNSKKFAGGEYDYELVYNSDNTAPDRIRFRNKENTDLKVISEGMLGKTYWLIMEGGKPVTDVNRYSDQRLAMEKIENAKGNTYVKYYDGAGNILATEEFVMKDGKLAEIKFFVLKMVDGTKKFVQVKDSKEIWKIKNKYYLKAIWVDHVKQVLYGPNLEELAPNQNVSIDKVINDIPDQRTRDIVRAKAADIKECRGFVMPSGKIISPSFRGPFSAVKEMQNYGLIDKSIKLPNLSPKTMVTFHPTVAGLQITGPGFMTFTSYQNMGMVNRPGSNPNVPTLPTIPKPPTPQTIRPTTRTANSGTPGA